MILKAALPLLVLTLIGCASNSTPRPIPVLAGARHCPVWPLPPAELLKPPAKTDFLDRTD